jgi:hypothetical protein
LAIACELDRCFTLDKSGLLASNKFVVDSKIIEWIIRIIFRSWFGIGLVLRSPNNLGNLSNTPKILSHHMKG